MCEGTGSPGGCGGTDVSLQALTVAPSLRWGLSGGRGAALRSEAPAVYTQGPPDSSPASHLAHTEGRDVMESES